jgi:alkaline phosphatase D
MGKLDFYDRGPDRPWLNRLLTNAAIVGHTTTTSARLWVRVWEPGEYWLLLSRESIEIDGKPDVDAATKEAKVQLEDGTTRPLPGKLWLKKFSFETDLTGIFELTDLEPTTRYYYCVFSAHERSDRWELKPDHVWRTFRTQSNDGDSLPINFGVFSCHMPYKKNGDLVNIPMWDRFAEELEGANADFVMGIGDQVYSDGNKTVSIWQYLKQNKAELLEQAPTREEQIKIMRSWYRDIYRGYWGFRQLQRVMGRYPTYMVWDDHEIMDGWGSYTREELGDQLDTIWEWENTEQNVSLAHQMFEAAKATYEEYQHSHNPTTNDGHYDYHFTWGHCAFYVLDMRGQRDFNRTTDDKILGQDQMDRLNKWLGSKEALSSSALFIVSPVPLVHIKNFIVNNLDLPLLGLADDLRDEWAHESNWVERNKLLDAVFDYSQKQGKRVMFLSGDVHIGAAFRLTRANHSTARVYQLTSSSITYPIPPLLKLAVQGNGKLGDTDHVEARKRTAFQILHPPFGRNNFAVISISSRPGGDVNISWNLYGGTGEEDEIARLKEVQLE